ncbi:MAG: Ger(x)C family spore germination protein [Ectobacillus sp.]
MKRHFKILLNVAICLSVVLISGCRDVKEIQLLNYATAIGVDYKNGKYHSYIQMVSFEGVAKTEGAEAPSSVWVSEAVAETFEDAFFEVYKTAQERIIWAHVTAILLSESALKEGFDHIFDSLTRYYEFRLTPWIFGTKEPVKEVLASYGFFKQSSLDTILHAPMSIHRQSSEIRPIKLHRFAREFFDPGETTFIPSITINKHTWKKNKLNESKLAQNGAFFMKNERYRGFFSLRELNGLRWLTPETKRASVVVPEEKNPEYQIVFEFPKSEIKVLFREGRPKFNIHLRITGYFVNRTHNRTLALKEIEEKTKKAIIREIEELYALGVEEKVDFFNFEHALFQQDYKAWQRLRKDGGTILTEDSLQNINVNLSIKHTGRVKNRSVDMKEID